MNDIVITYDENINSENRLRRILRGIESWCEGYNEIYIVGDKPEWIQGVIHIGYTGADKQYLLRNQYHKLRACCLRRELTNVFYWIDADDYLVKFDARKGLRISIPPASVMSYKPKGTEQISHKHTQNLMYRRGFGNKADFFNKYPMSFRKDRLQNTFDDIDFETKYGYCIKTLYANFNRLQPTSHEIEHIDLTDLNKKSTYERID